MLRTLTRRCLVLAGAGALIAGCSHTYAAGNALTVKVALTEYRLVPQRISVREGVLTLIVRNDGRLAHNLVVTKDGGFVDATKPLHPGQSARLVLLLAPGTYRLASSLPSDDIVGLYGNVSVTS